MGLATPSFYNSVNLENYKTSSPKHDWKISKQVRIKPLKRTPAGQAEVSPAAYKPDESLKKKIFASVPTNAFCKEKGKSFIAEYQTKKKWVPAPNNYDVDKAYTRITIGARKGYK